MGTGSISQYICKAKRNERFLHELYAKQQGLEAKNKCVVDHIASLLDGGNSENNISKVEDVLNTLDSDVIEQYGIKPDFIRKVLKEDFNMTYRKVTVLSPNQNSERNLILRQQWAIIYLGILKDKKRIINIDESTLG